MTKPDKTLIAVILDRSGSMQMIQSDMEGGMNAFLKEQANVSGECQLFFSQFDTQYEVLTDFVDIKNAPYFHLEPRGMTALLDAMGRTITTVGERLAALPEDERPAHVLVVIITDGLENSSHQWSREKVMELVKQQTDQYGWTFTYLGANQDAIAVAASYGIDASTTMDFAASSAGVANTYRSLSLNTTLLRGGQSFGYSDEDREDAAEE